MATRAQVERIRTANAEIVRLARAEFDSLVASLDLSRPDLVRDALTEYLPALTAEYGDLAASVAAEWFEELYAASGRKARFTPSLAPVVDSRAIEGTVKWAAGSLYAETPTVAPALRAAVSRWVLQPGRETVARNASRTSARWARVPSGSETCAFCLLTASRGFVYTTEQTAGRGNEYHDDCDCVPTPDWSRHPRLEGYDPDGMYLIYNDAANAADTRNDINAILAVMREQNPGMK